MITLLLLGTVYYCFTAWMISERLLKQLRINTLTHLLLSCAWLLFLLLLLQVKMVDYIADYLESVEDR